MGKKSEGAHHWRFFRAGGVDQVRIDTGEDVVNIGRLDQKLWVALSCPVKGLEFDERTLAMLDRDGAGRVRASEIIAAAEWTGAMLKSPDGLAKGEDGLPLASIRDADPEGKRILASARLILKSLGKEEATKVTVADAMSTAQVFAQAKLNGDGVVPPEFVKDPEARKVAEEIVLCFGGAPDRSGKPGIDRARLDRFFAEAQAFSDWWKKAAADAKAVLPLGDRTTAAHEAVQAVRAKVDDYFARCRLAAYDARALAAVNKGEEAYLEIAAKDLSITAQEVAHFPLALIEAQKPLPLEDGLNPAWADAVPRFRREAVAPLLGDDRASLAEADWAALRAKLAAHDAWQAAKAGGAVEGLGLARVREILAGKTRETLAAAIAEDEAVASEVGAIGQVERLARYYRDLFPLLRNFVSFIDFYSRKMAVFQAGTLYLDGRACHLCVRVNDPGKHGILGVMSRAYLAYADCTRVSGEKMTVAAAVTAGDSDNLFVGRNGIFYDRAGRDWDATITKVIENPISIRQAFWSPYKKLLRWIESTAAKRAAAADEASTGMLQKTATTAGTAAETGKAPPPKKLDIGVVAAIGVAVGGIATAVSALLSSFFGLGLWMPAGVLGLLLLISGPAMLIAWLKLRERNLGPILDANGWAVNALAKVNIPLGAALTDRARLPKGASRSLVDPYKPKRSIWARLFLLLVVVGAIGYGLHAAGIVDWSKVFRYLRYGIFGGPEA